MYAKTCQPLRLLKLALIIGLSSSAGLVNANNYTFTPLGSLGGNFSEANAINNAGLVVGSATLADGITRHATLWNGSTVTDLGTLGGTFSYAYAINNLGQIVGNSYLAGNTVQHATLWDGSVATDLGTLGGDFSVAKDISDNGLITGSSFNTAGTMQAVLWNGTSISSLTDTGSNGNGINNSRQIVGFSDSATFSAILWDGSNATNLAPLVEAFAINNSGQVVGSLFNGSGSIAGLWDEGVTTDLGTLGGFQSKAFAINNVGQIAGYSYTPGNTTFHATLWDGTSIVDLNSFLDASAVSAGWELLVANGINDSGWIVGTARNTITGFSSGYLLSVTAVPEPESYAMLLVGLGLIGTVARRKS